ncbi:MAG: DnaJ-like cysteine-rich domain-containing protein [Planctomycetota bacterium]
MKECMDISKTEFSAGNETKQSRNVSGHLSQRKNPTWEGVLTLATLVVVVGCLATQPAWAVLVFLKGEDQPIRGYLVREDEDEIVISQPQADGTTTRQEIISRSDIDDVIRTVSADRLESLRPSEPDAYREYAEELAEKKKDPDARIMSLRLFLIAAHLAPDRLGRSCLLGMVPLARSNSEKRRFRAMAYLLDPAHDARTLSMPVETNVDNPSLDPEQAELIVLALRTLRQGKRNAAMNLARRGNMQENLPKLTGTITFSEFEAGCATVCPHCQQGRQICPECNGRKRVDDRSCPTCNGRGRVTCRHCGGEYRRNPISSSLLKRIVQLELARLPETESRRSTSGSRKINWSRGVRQGDLEPLPPLSLKSLTEFDPRKNVFREGEWTSL